MMKIMKIRMISSVVMFILIFILTMITLFAYFQIQEDHGIIISSGEFEAELLVSFNDEVVDLESEYYDHDKQKVIINMYDVRCRKLCRQSKN